MLVFEERAKTRVPGEKPLGAKGKTNNKLNPHMARRQHLKPGYIGGRRVLSPLRHPCSPQDDDDEHNDDDDDDDVDDVDDRPASKISEGLLAG